MDIDISISFKFGEYGLKKYKPYKLSACFNISMIITIFDIQELISKLKAWKNYKTN